MKVAKEITDFNLIKSMELDILKYFHKVCIENNIKYSLAYGTLLGAVRHEGFIPWDDDIDVSMTPEEYEKLRNIWDHEFYKLVDCFSDDAYIYPFPKIIDERTYMIENNDNDSYEMGLYIDIFVLYPVDIARKEEVYKKLIRLEKERLYSSLEKNAIYKDNGINLHRVLLWKYLNLKGPAYFSKKICNYLSSLNSGENSIYIGTGTREPEKTEMIKEEFENLILANFEDQKFYIFKNYDQILRRQYGEYMQLPSENDRVSHNFKLYMK